MREFREIMDSLCTHCGVCCKKQAVFLTDAEAPIIAQAMVELGGTSLAKEHLSLNSTVFNLWDRYVLNFDDQCPFHIDNQCLIYSKRPLTCQLFPINLIGFIDQPDSALRTAYFEVERPPESYACGGSCDEMIRVSQRAHEKRPESVNEILQFFVSTYLDERALGYLFGQTRKREKDAATLSSSTPTAREITFAILQQYGSQFDDPGEIPDEFLDYSKSISDEDIVRLTSVAAKRNSERVTSTRMDRLKMQKPKLIEYWLENHLSTKGGTIT
ncbi:MAG: YkgJ family cysteine cluster protein [Promethearchaeota archaeon]